MDRLKEASTAVTGELQALALAAKQGVASVQTARAAASDSARASVALRSKLEQLDEVELGVEDRRVEGRGVKEGTEGEFTSAHLCCQSCTAAARRQQPCTACMHQPGASRPVSRCPSAHFSTPVPTTAGLLGARALRGRVAQHHVRQNPVLRKPRLPHCAAREQPAPRSATAGPPGAVRLPGGVA